jgi:hypothetical protein
MNKIKNLMLGEAISIARTYQNQQLFLDFILPRGLELTPIECADTLIHPEKLHD